MGRELRMGTGRVVGYALLGLLLFAWGAALAVVSLVRGHGHPLEFAISMALTVSAGTCFLAAFWRPRTAAFDARPPDTDRSRVFRGFTPAAGTLAQKILFTRDLVRLCVDSPGLVVLRRTDYGRAWGAALAFLFLLPTQALPALMAFQVVACCLLLWILAVDRGPSRAETTVPWSRVRAAVETPKGIVLFFADDDPVDRMEVEFSPRLRAALLAAVEGRCPVIPLATPPGPGPQARHPIDARTPKVLDAARESLRRLEF